MIFFPHDSDTDLDMIATITHLYDDRYVLILDLELLSENFSENISETLLKFTEYKSTDEFIIGKEKLEDSQDVEDDKYTLGTRWMERDTMYVMLEKFRQMIVECEREGEDELSPITIQVLLRHFSEAFDPSTVQLETTAYIIELEQLTIKYSALMSTGLLERVRTEIEDRLSI